MTTLLVDIGNTRVKWALLRGARLGRMHARAHQAGAGALRALVRSAPGDVMRVLAVSVAGAKLDRELSSAVRARFGLPVEFVRSVRTAAGVRNGYRDTWRLGADRWVGIIAAHAIAGVRHALVVNIGTALTIDAVTRDGRHLGGVIAPGPSTMVASLLDGTHGIRRRAAGKAKRRVVPRSFARDTASALAAGAVLAAASLIDRAMQEATATLRAAPLLLLTGGAAAQLRPYLKTRCRVVPDLVLRGLGVLARGPQRVS